MVDDDDGDDELLIDISNRYAEIINRNIQIYTVTKIATNVYN